MVIIGKAGKTSTREDMLTMQPLFRSTIGPSAMWQICSHTEGSCTAQGNYIARMQYSAKQVASHKEGRCTAQVSYLARMLCSAK